MPTRTPYTSAALEVLTSANFEKMPKGWVGYSEKETDQLNVGTSETDVTDMSVAQPVVSGRRYRISAKLRTNPDNDPMEIIARLYAGATQIDSDSWRTVVTTENHRMNLLAVYDAPSTTTVTFKVTAQSLTGSTTFDCLASEITPSFILIEDVGPTS